MLRNTPRSADVTAQYDFPPQPGWLLQRPFVIHQRLKQITGGTNTKRTCPRGACGVWGGDMGRSAADGAEDRSVGDRPEQTGGAWVTLGIECSGRGACRG